MNAMNGRICLVTGATSGIGKATAQGLADMGATVALVARNPHKGQATVEEIREKTGNANLDVLVADLSSQAEIRKLADEFKRRYSALHVLVNNAGGIFGERLITLDGIEMTLALDHLAPFLLTNLLLDVLKASAPARIINLTSGAQVMGKINFDDLEGKKRYDGQAAYNQSKLANVLFTYELARRLAPHLPSAYVKEGAGQAPHLPSVHLEEGAGQAGSGVSVNCVHPGAVRTNYGRENPTRLLRVVIPLLAPLLRTPEKGAETVLYLATSPEVEGVTGKYFVDKRARPSSKRSYDTQVAARLWQVSEEMTGLAMKEERVS
jgi:NAD(P)-dependent dehydrogenase (short-subunit alcohol dehydrogenase family)